MYPITRELLDAIADDRRKDADDYRRAKAATSETQRDRRQPRPAIQALRRIALGALRK
jgi:hypothetical protein